MMRMFIRNDKFIWNDKESAGMTESYDMRRLPRCARNDKVNVIRNDRVVYDENVYS